MLHLAGKASIRRRPVNSAFGVEMPHHPACPAAALLTCLALVAQAATDPNVQRFNELAMSRVKTTEAKQALREGSPEDFHRWGKETCNWVKIGKANFAQVTENLAQFFGEDLAGALVYAARAVVCPELADNAARQVPKLAPSPQ